MKTLQKTVTLNFFKEAKSEESTYLSFESNIQEERFNYSKQDPLTAVIEVNNLLFHEPTGKFLAKKYPSAVNFFNSKVVNLLIYNGNQDWISENAHSQSMSIKGSIKEAETTIFWRLDDVNYFSMIANALNLPRFTSVQVVLECADDFFDQFEKDFKDEIRVRNISLNFE